LRADALLGEEKNAAVIACTHRVDKSRRKDVDILDGGIFATVEIFNAKEAAGDAGVDDRRIEGLDFAIDDVFRGKVVINTTEILV